MVSTVAESQQVKNGKGEQSMDSRLRVLAYLLLVLLAAVIMISICPSSQEPGIDSGAFLYIGEQVLQHHLPYVDTFDHKGPVIYYLDALGLFLGHRSVWGVWIIEVLGLLGATFLGFRVIRSLFGFSSAFWASALWLITLSSTLEGGNLTEEYGLPLQFLCLYLLFQSDRKGYSLWRGILIGCASGCLFFLRPNLIAIPLALIIYSFGRLLLHRESKISTFSVGIITGGLIVSALVFGHFGYRHALSTFWECAFAYNFSYSHSTPVQRIHSMIFGFRLMPLISLASIFAWCLLVYLKRSRRLPTLFSSPVVIVSFLAFPIECFLSSTSGRAYSHYYMTWLPSMAVLSGVSAYSLIVGLQSHGKEPAVSTTARKVTVPAVLVIAATMLLCTTSIAKDAYTALSLLKHTAPTERSNSVADYVVQRTNENDKVLVLGSKYSRINFLSHRQSPTRFAYQLPLYDETIRQRYVREFVGDVRDDAPRIIVESPEFADRTNRFWSIPGITVFQSFFESNYHLSRTINDGNLRWRIFERNTH